MADKKINEFQTLTTASDSDLLLVSSTDETYNIAVSTLKDATNAVAQSAVTTANAALNMVNNAVRYNEAQSLTDAQKNTAITNIDAAGLSNLDNDKYAINGGYASNSLPNMVGTNGKWTATTSTPAATHIMVPVHPGDSVSITAKSSQAAHYSVLRSFDPAIAGTTANFSTSEGFTSRVTVSSGTTATFTAPSDAAYIAMTKETAGVNFMPALLTINGNDALTGIRGQVSEITQNVSNIGESVNGVINAITCDPVTISLEVGGLNATTGKGSDFNYRCRSTLGNRISDLMYFQLSDTSYRAMIWLYTASNRVSGTRCVTNGEYTDISNGLWVAPNAGDHYYIISFTKPDNSILTTDITDPTSDYSKVLAALTIKHYYMHPFGCSFSENYSLNYGRDVDSNTNYTVIRVYKNRIDGGVQYPFVYAPNGAGAATDSTLTMNLSTGWCIAINAGIFDYSGGTMTPHGRLVQNNTVIQDVLSNKDGATLTIDSNGDLSYANKSVTAATLVSNGIVSAVMGWGAIVENYSPSSEYSSSERAQRQIIGQFGNGDYAIVTCEGRNFDGSTGWTSAQAQSVCIKLGLKFAFNLDGGSSTETVIGVKQLNTIYEGTSGRSVPTYIVFNGTNTFSVPNA